MRSLWFLAALALVLLLGIWGPVQAEKSAEGEAVATTDRRLPPPKAKGEVRPQKDAAKGDAASGGER